MNHNELKGHPKFYMGAAVSPGFVPIEIQIIKMIKKIAAGAKFFQTQAVFDIETVREFRDRTKNFECKVLIGVIPLKSPGMARFLNKNIPGVDVPEHIIERMEKVGKENYREEGMKNELKGHPKFYMGAAVSPGFVPIEIQIIKMIKKIAAGAKFFQTQAVFDIETVREFRDRTKNFECKVLIGVIPLKSPGMARFLNKNIPGVDVPEHIIERMEKVGKENYREEGMKIAAEFIKQLKEENLCDGVHIMSVGAEKNIPKIIEMAGIER